MAELTSAQIIERGFAALPGCYSRELDDCIAETNLSMPGCQAILDAYEVDYDAVESRVDAIPFCSPPARATVLIWLGGGVAVGLVAALILFRRARS